MIAPKRADPEAEIDHEHGRPRCNQSQALVIGCERLRDIIRPERKQTEKYDRDQWLVDDERIGGVPVAAAGAETGAEREHRRGHEQARSCDCLLYTSDAADE